MEKEFLDTLSVDRALDRAVVQSTAFERRRPWAALAVAGAVAVTASLAVVVVQAPTLDPFKAFEDTPAAAVAAGRPAEARRDAGAGGVNGTVAGLVAWLDCAIVGADGD